MLEIYIDDLVDLLVAKDKQPKGLKNEFASLSL